MQRPVLDMEALAAENSVLRAELAELKKPPAEPPNRLDPPPTPRFNLGRALASHWVSYLLVTIAALGAGKLVLKIHRAAQAPPTVVCYQVEAPKRPFADYILVSIVENWDGSQDHKDVAFFRTVDLVGAYIDAHGLRGDMCIR